MVACNSQQELKMSNMYASLLKPIKQNDCFPAQIEEVSDTPLLRVIEKLGGWPVTDSEWNSNNAIDLETLVAVIKRNFTLGCRPCPFILIFLRTHCIQILYRFYPNFEKI